MAKGSIHETQDHLTTAFDEEFISAQELKQHWALAEEALRVINGYINYLQKMTDNNSVSDPHVDYSTSFSISEDVPDDLPLTTDN